MITKIPKEVRRVLEQLQHAGYEAYIVGGCVRDLYANRAPKDWDVTTNAHPQKIQEIFPDSFYENNFGTVGVKVAPFLTNGKKDREHDIVEVTTYRIESTYSDKRRPDSVQFAHTLHEDLSRRDFTMNAIALDLNGQLIDPFNGIKDIQKKCIRSVGDPTQRFNEDALRMMRAVRFAAELDFDIDHTTHNAIIAQNHLLQHVSIERIRDEFIRIILSNHINHGITTLHKTHLLSYFLPELEYGINVEQNHHHTLTVWEHNLSAAQHCPSKKLDVRLATLFHDIGKPESKKGTGRNCTFYNHEYISARITKTILHRLRFSKKIIDRTVLLVKNHMFYYNVDEVSEAAVRRIIKKVGQENIKDLIAVRIGDRLGSGTPKAKPYKLRHFEYMVEKVSHDPITVKMLKINGTTLIKKLNIPPGPHIGALLDVLLSEVIENPQHNTEQYLIQRVHALRNEDLTTLRHYAKKEIHNKNKKNDQKRKAKYWIQ